MTDQPTGDGGSDDRSAPRPTRLTYEIDANERPSEAVTRAISELTGTPVIELEPLYDTIDPEHLDTCLEGTSSEPPEIEVSFTYYQCSLTVTASEVIVEAHPSDT